MTVKYFVYRLFSPFLKNRMIWGYKVRGGKFLKYTRIGSTTFIDNKKNLIIGNNVFIGHYNYIEASNGVTIGEGCQITNFISITSHSSHIAIRLYGNKYAAFSDHIGYVKGRVQIGNYSFVGPHCVIMPGTEIGKGSLVASYSYVDGKFPDFSILKGNPATVVGDTRTIDSSFLDQHNELRAFYDDWANEKE
jgi:acetyltransferase-like isoleucine patch superfamily enzyme